MDLSRLLIGPPAPGDPKELGGELVMKGFISGGPGDLLLRPPEAICSPEQGVDSDVKDDVKD